jgi:hypothetical protein
MAGIGEILSHEANKLGHHSLVIQKRDLDPFGFGDYYGNTVYVDALDKYVELLFESSRESDIVIVHDWIEFLDEIECPNIYVYFHGSKLRTLPPEQIPEIEKKVKGIILSTPDLLQYCPNGFVLPQPVDLELFKNFNKPRSYDQVTINRSYQRDYIEPLIKTRYPKCDYVVRNTTRPIPYDKMPDYLNNIKTYIDWKFDYSKPNPKTINAYSTTALQALSCGCTVVNSNAVRLSKTLLRKHDSKIVVQEFLKYIGADRPSD